MLLLSKFKLAFAPIIIIFVSQLIVIYAC
jgi:hypothetical protein